jgi:hypothetical protein
VTRIVATPYMQAVNGVDCGRWEVTMRDSSFPAPDVLRGWDFATSLKFDSAVTLDLNAVLQQCGLTSGARVALVALWSSSSTGLRRLAASEEVTTSDDLVLHFEIEPGVAGGRLTIERRIVLLRAGEATSDLAPRVPGATLWREPRGMVQTIILEGDATRFPTEAVDFSRSVVGAPEAIWWLWADLADLTANPLGAVRLYLNENNAIVRRLLGGTDDEMTRSLKEVLEWDVARALMDRALEEPEFAAGWGTFGAGSVGETLQTLMQKLFPGHDCDSLRALRAADAGVFDARLQASFRLFRDA